MQDVVLPDSHKMLLAGERVDSASGETFAVENPAKRSVIAHVPRAGAEDVDRAVAAASAAFADWRLVPARERGKLLLKIAEVLEGRLEELARTIATETGNALRTQARPEATLTADIFRYFGGLASEIKGETLPLGENVLSYSRREPIGVVGAIIPWNAPVLLAALKIAPALSTGNTVVIKAAEDAPLGVLMMAQACQELLPPGVLNVLTGYGHDCGAALAQHPGIRKLSFTGSTEVGKLIMKAAADRLVPVSLELGGKSPSIVFPDANEDWAVSGIINAMRFTRQSQSCTAGSRLFLHASIFDEFLEKLAAKTTALKMGDPLDEASDMGSIINEKQFRKVCGYVEEGLSRADARLVIGGLPPDSGPLSEGWFARPTIFADASNDWRLAREEIFGPVLVAIRWEDEAEVVRMANDSHYGLAAFVWSRDIGQALRTAHRVEAGWVQVNQGVGQVLGQSYGGTKQSGIGREFSLEGMLDSFTQRKSVTVNLDLSRTLNAQRSRRPGVLGPLLIAAAGMLVCGPGAAQMPGCEISFHAVDPDGTVREQPVVGARHVLEVRQDEAEDGAGPGSRRFAVTLDDAGARALQTHTAASIGQVLAVRCDREIVSQPEIREALRSPVAVLVDELPAGHPPGLEDLDAPHEILAWVDLPRAVALGDPVSLQLTVVNGRAQGVFQLTSIDIGDGFLDGFEVLAISPTPHSREHALGVLALALPADIAPGAEWQLEIRLKPRRAGVFVGDVDIWAGGRFLTRVAQLQVR